MKVKFTPFNGEPFEVVITKEFRNGITPYRFTHKDFIGFQFDCHDRPSDYHKDNRVGMIFRGFLKGKPNKPNIETSMTIVEL